MARTKTVASSEDSETYEVAKILDHSPKKPGMNKSHYQYKIRWKGYSAKYDTWEPADCLEGAQATLNAYYKENIAKDKPNKPKARSASVGSEAPISKKRRSESEQETSKEHSSPKKALPAEEDEDETPAAATSATMQESEDEAAPKPKQRAKPKTATRQRESSPAVRPTSTPQPEPHINGDVEDEDLPNGKEQRRLEKILRKNMELASWEDKVMLSNVERHPPVGGDLRFMVTWEDRIEGYVANRMLRDKAPQKVIDFYEAALKFN